MNRESRIWEWVQKAPGACAGGSVAFGLPTAALGCPRTSVLRCFMRLELSGALYLLSCKWDAWKGLQAESEAAALWLALVVGPWIWVLSPWSVTLHWELPPGEFPDVWRGHRVLGLCYSLRTGPSEGQVSTWALWAGCALCQGKTWKIYLRLPLFYLLALNVGYVNSFSVSDTIFLVDPFSFLDIGNLRLLMCHQQKFSQTG